MFDKPQVQEDSNRKIENINLSSTAKLAVSQEEGIEPYEPWKNRNLTHPLGSCFPNRFCIMGWETLQAKKALYSLCYTYKAIYCPQAKTYISISTAWTMGALFHMIKGSLGSGILSMPVAFKNGGLWVSLVGTILVGLIYIHCCHILVYSCQVLCTRIKKPQLGFSEIAEAAFSTGAARWRPYTSVAKNVVDIGLLLAYYLCCIVYVVFSATSIKQVVEYNFDITMDIRIYILLVTIMVVPIGMIRNLKFLVPFSFIAICALTFGCGFVLYDVFQDLPPLSSRPAITSYDQLPLFFSTIIYAMDGIGTVLPIENAMKKPQHFLGCPGVLGVSMVWLIALYAAMGFFGYLRYGDATEGSITLNISSSFMGQAVKLMVALNVLCSYGLFLYVPSEIFWRNVEGKVKESKKTMYFYLMRLALVLVSVLFAVIVPDLEPFVGLVGSVCSSSLVLFFPPVIELVTFWEDEEYMGRYQWRFYKNLLLLAFWLETLITGTHVSLTRIIDLYR